MFDDDDERVQHPHSVVSYPIPVTVGRCLDVDTDWTEIAELLDASCRLTAPKRNITELDTQT